MPRGAPLTALVLFLAGCTDDSRSPVGADLLPGGILGGDLEVVTLRGVERAVEYEVFPAERGFAGILVTAHAWPSDPGFESRALFRHVVTDLDSLPEEREVLSAFVRLVYTTPEEPVTLSVHQLTSEWAVAAATWERRDLGQPWTQPGGDFEPVPLAMLTLEPAAGDTAETDSISVAIPTPLVENWITGDTPNAGLILVQQTPGVALEMRSRESGLGPRLDVEVQIGEPGDPVGVERILAREDVFIVTDQGAAPEDDGLVVSAGGPVRRVFLRPSLEGVPEGATIVSAALILSVDRTRIAGDSLGLVARRVLSEFRGEKTILFPPPSDLGRAFLMEATPADSVVLGSSLLTARVRDWLRDPGTNLGIVVTVLGESTTFGEIGLFGPEASLDLQPRLRLVVLPPPVGQSAP